MLNFVLINCKKKVLDVLKKLKNLDYNEWHFETPLCWVTASKMSILAKENNDMHWKSGFEVFNAFGSIREKCYWSDIWIIMMIYLKLGLESKSIQNEDVVIDMTVACPPGPK